MLADTIDEMYFLELAFSKVDVKNVWVKRRA